MTMLSLRTISECAICGMKLLMRDLYLSGQYNVWVCREDYEALHPSEFDIDVGEVYRINPAPEVSIPDCNGFAAPVISFGPNGELIFIGGDPCPPLGTVLPVVVNVPTAAINWKPLALSQVSQIGINDNIISVPTAHITWHALMTSLLIDTVVKVPTAAVNWHPIAVTASQAGTDWAYLDAQDQLTSLLGTTVYSVTTTVAGDGNLIVSYRYANPVVSGVGYRVAKLNKSSLAVMQSIDTEAMTPSVPPTLVAMNAAGDLAIVSVPNFVFWVLPHGTTTPVKMSSPSDQSFTSVVMNPAGDFFAAGIISLTVNPKFGIVRYTAATNTHSNFVTWNEDATIAGPASLIADDVGDIYLAKSHASLGVWDVIKYDGSSGAQIWTYGISRPGFSTLGSIQIAGDGSIWYTADQTSQVSIFRIDPTRSSETLVFATGAPFTNTGPLARDWGSGDILYANADGIRRWNQSGTFLHLSTTVSTEYLATSAAFPSPLFASQIAAAIGGIDRFIAFHS